MGDREVQQARRSGIRPEIRMKYQDHVSKLALGLRSTTGARTRGTGASAGLVERPSEDPPVDEGPEDHDRTRIPAARVTKTTMPLSIFSRRMTPKKSTSTMMQAVHRGNSRAKSRPTSNRREQHAAVERGPCCRARRRCSRGRRRRCSSRNMNTREARDPVGHEGPLAGLALVDGAAGGGAHAARSRNPGVAGRGALAVAVPAVAPSWSRRRTRRRR